MHIFQPKMYPFSKHLTFENRFPCHVDNAAYPHDSHADKRRYRAGRQGYSSMKRNQYRSPFPLFSSFGGGGNLGHYHYAFTNFRC